MTQVTASNLPRVDLTAAILTALATLVPVGDGIAPDTGGWDDDPNLPTSSYTAYAVLVPQMATSIVGPFGDESSDWEVPYALMTYGISREDVEWVSYKARQAILNLVREVITLDTQSWKVTQGRINSLGGLTRNDAVEPSEYSETDIVVVRMSKEF